MLPQISYIGNPVLSLQTMLRELSFQYPVIPRLIPTGAFDERTLEAVMVFQREFYPPVTGVVDNGTWDAIAVLYQQALRCLAGPLPCRAWPGRGFTVAPGQSSVHLLPVQAMFKGLAVFLDGVEDAPVTGVHDGSSVRNTRWVQRCCGQVEDGVMDKDGWDALARLYTVFVSYAQTPWLTRPEQWGGPSDG